MTTNEIDIAWAAGLFEGEGCFVFTYGKPKSAQIQMTDLDVLEKIHRLFGGTLNSSGKRQEHWKECWRWSVFSNDAKSFIEKILPYMMERRRGRAEEWLAKYNERILVAENKVSDIAYMRQAVKDMYKAGGLTQQLIADQFGIERSYVAHIIRGKYDK